jgi:predicted aminopeptidase
MTAPRGLVRSLFRTALGSLVALSLSGCGIGYYGHTLWGGARILLDRRPIERVVADPETPPELRDRLGLVERLIAFAGEELGLEGGKSFRTYVALDRPYAVWNVVAAPQLSIDPLTWCFPIAGCVGYRGYFSERRAAEFAAGLRTQGYEVDWGGVAAYSTLGYFADPVLSSFVFWPESDLAGLLFHELAHRRVYVTDSTAFNESFATAVELEGVERWLARQGDPREAAAVREHYRREEEIVALLFDYRGRLAEAYAAERPEAWKRERKAELLAELSAAYRDLRAAGGGTRGYDAWFSEPPNNARLAAIGAYHRWVPAFEALLASNGGDLTAFYEAAKRLAALPAAAREERLRRYSGE